MWALYRVDVTGPFGVRLVEALVRRLPYEPASMWRAKQALGDEKWLHWGHAEEQRANLQDIDVLTAKATARAKARISDSERAARPEPGRRRTPRPRSMSDKAGMMALVASLNG